VIQEQAMPIDLMAVNWAYVGILAGFAFVAALLGSLISFRNRFIGAIIAGVLFALAFLYWTYYPHPTIPGPITIGSITPASSPAPAAPAAASSPPANPVTTLSTAPVTPAPVTPAPVTPAPVSPAPDNPAPAGAK
jgi:uncharacterized membrane protein YuzA (DUF378 family)